MINVGVIGLGMMGQTHLDAYAKRADVKVVAISDKDADRLSERGWEQARGLGLHRAGIAVRHRFVEPYIALEPRSA